MQDQEPSAPSGPEWLEPLRRQLGLRTEAIAAALEDVADWCGDTVAVGWVDIREEPKLTVYIVAGGSPVLYRLTGERDPILDQWGSDAGPKTSNCDCRPIPITTDAGFSLSVTRRWRNSHAGTTERRWAFRLAGEEPLKIDYPPPPVESGLPPMPGPDPTQFARALAAEITRVRSLGGNLQ
jgi:hypothetical protein